MISEGNISPCCQKKFVREKLKTVKVENERKLTENQQVTPSRILPAPLQLAFILFLSLFFVLQFLLAMTLYSLPLIRHYDIKNGRDIPNLKHLGVQAVCIWFCAIEFIIRFIFSPNKFQFAKGWMNILDILAILPADLSIVVVLVQASQPWACT